MAKRYQRGNQNLYIEEDNAMATRYQRGNQNLYIEEQTIQWLKDTKGVIKICISKNRQYNGYKIPKG
jgi:hypothetical protein